MRNAWSGSVFRASLPDVLAWKLALACFGEIAAGGIRLAAVRVKTGPCHAVTHIPGRGWQSRINEALSKAVGL